MPAPGGTDRMVSRTIAGIAVVYWAAVLYFMLGHSYCLYDDAYIYFRFVENTVSGCPLAYNCVDGPVEGFTSPLYFLLLLAGRLITPDLESWSQVLGALFLGLAGTVAIVTAASSRFDRPGAAPWHRALRGALVAAVLALDHFFLLYAVIGLETALAALWGGLLLCSLTSGGRPWLRTLAVVGIFVRPEFALVFVALPMVLPEARKPLYWWPIVAAGVVTVATRLLIFGDWLPNTFWAKSGGTVDHARLGWAYLVGCLVDFPIVALSPLVLLARRVRRGSGVMVLVGAAWLLFFLRSGGDFFEYGRMLVPLVPALTVLAVVGICEVLRLVLRNQPKLAWLVPVATAVVVAAFAGRAALTHGIPQQHGMARVERWAKVGQFLARHHPGATVAATPVGAIGYFSGARIIDLVGLVDRTVAKEGTRIPDLNSKGKIGHEKVNTDYVLSQKPDILIIDAWKREPWGRGDQVFTQFHGEWELIDAISRGSAPYRPYTPEVAENLHWFMFVRYLPESEAGGQ